MKNSPGSRVAAKATSSGSSRAAQASRSSPRSTNRTKKTKVDIAIARELAPAAALAVLEKSAPASDASPPALEVLVAGVAEGQDDGKLRVQLMFDNGSVLPVEMSPAAGKKLEAGLAKQRLAKK